MKDINWALQQAKELGMNADYIAGQGKGPFPYYKFISFIEYCLELGADEKFLNGKGWSDYYNCMNAEFAFLEE